jgi:hypothetical protein
MHTSSIFDKLRARSTGYAQTVATFFLCLLASVLGSGCSALISQAKNVFWQAEKSKRTPGEKLVTDPDRVWAEYQCSKQKLPFIRVEENRIVPPKLSPAQEFDHHLVYVVCSSNQRQVVTGTLYTRIRLGGRAIVTDVAKGFKLKPGRWTKDTFITIPATAELGSYSLEIEFKGESAKFRETQNFVVTTSTAWPK